MDLERARALMLTLPHVIEAEQFGGLIYFVGDKAIGGKMCLHLNSEPAAGLPVSYPAGPERFAELCEREGFVPAPYMARNFWIAVERWENLRTPEWHSELRAAHAITCAKLPPRTQAILAMPRREQNNLVRDPRKLLAEKAAGKRSTPKPNMEKP